ncbi:UvrD-helicase domain-containing protein [Desulfovibrio sp. OttesenSCG-928-G15]|nr:UvrD-helicase domain-containing protein [Desulfovibrio sp. OttesenSCG-928-G15]
MPPRTDSGAGIFAESGTPLAVAAAPCTGGGAATATGPPDRRAPVMLTSDAASLRAGLEKACENLAYTSDFSGFTPKNRLHDALLIITERLLRGEETPPMHSDTLFATLGSLHAAAMRAAQNMLDMLEKEQLKAQSNYLKFLRACLGTPVFSPLPDSVFLHKDSLADCLLKSSKDACSGAAYKAFAKNTETLRDYATALPLFQQALTLAPLVALAAELHARMDARMREGADRLLPAILLPYLAGQVLQGETGVSDALCRLGSRLGQILLDEFQDTSREQWAAIAPLGLEGLSTGGSLTYVGDVKQAIYGWRGGDAKLFEEVAVDQELTAVSGPVSRQTLDCNWRSHPLVVANNNAFFSRLAKPVTAKRVLSAMLPEETPDEYIDLAVTMATRYFADTVQQIPPQKDWTGDPRSALANVRLYRAEAKTLDDLNALVKARLRALLCKELLPVWNYRDIALLVRTGNESATVAAWLAEWGIPVVTENSFLLEANPLVTRLVSFLSFLAYPLDDLAFWEFVGSEVTFASQDDAEAWLASITRLYGKRRPPLYRLFRQDFPDFWNAHIAPFYAEAGLMSAYDTLMETVRHFGLENTVPEQMPFVRRLLELAHLAESRGHSSLAAFLAFWRELGNNEKLPLPESMNAVRILTIHKAKGLEFPVVILPFQHRGQTRSPAYTVQEVHGLRLLAKAGSDQPDLYYPQIVADELERLNLLYVAWTRPVYALHAFVTNAGRAGPLVRALEALLEDFTVQTEILGPVEEAEAPEDCGPDTAEADKNLQTCVPAAPAPFAIAGQGEALSEAASEPWRPMNWLPRLRIYRSPLPAPGFTARQRGILAHLCLEHLILTYAPEASAESQAQTILADVQKALRMGIRHFPFPLENAQETAAGLGKGLVWFAKTPLARFWLESGRREQEIMDASGRMHRVDLLADDSRVLHAVDYKTGKADPAYREQVVRYMRLTSQASGRQVRGFLVYLDEQRLEEVLPEGEAAQGGRP